MPNRDASENILPATLARLGLGKSTLPPGAETDKDRLVIALTSQEWSVRAAAIRALGKLGEQVPIEHFVAALGDENDVVRAAAAHALGTLKERAPIEPLVFALRDSAWRVRAAAALALGQMGERAPIDELVALVNDEDASVCAAAVQALGEMGERVPIETLVLALNDQDWSVREAAAMTLGNIGRRAPVEPLVAALRDKDSLVREAARQALQRTHPERLPEISSRLEEEMVSSEADQKALATQLIEETNRINAQCEMVHQDARSLINMTNAQLLQASSLSLLKDMAVHAEFAYSGNQQAQLEGAVKVFSDMQSLASFDVEVYKQ